jgi:streptogramin lyase
VADSGDNRVRYVTPANIIQTIAGDGLPFPLSGDNLQEIPTGYPLGVAVDDAGNVYVSDAGEQLIRRLASNGVVTTIAGTTQAGFSGDGGPALLADLDRPIRITVDNAGNIVFIDAANSRVRRISTDGVIRTVAGTGNTGYNPDQNNGPATSADLDIPSGLAVDDAGNIYIAEFRGNVVRRVDIATGLITVFAGGTTQSAIPLPGTLAMDGSGNLYVVSSSDLSLNDMILKINPQGFQTAFAGTCTAAMGGSTQVPDGIPASAACFAYLSLTGISADGLGNVYIADSGRDVIYKVTPDGILHLFAGSAAGMTGYSGDGGPALQATLDLGDYTGGSSLGTVQASGNGSIAASATGDLHIGTIVNSNMDLSSVILPFDGRLRKILAATPYLSQPEQINLVGQSGGRIVTGSLSVITTLNPGSSTPVPGMAYTTQVTSGSAWLSVSPDSGSTPGLLTVTADPFTLAPGVYQGTITINVAFANPSAQTVTVQFSVGQAVAASIAVDHDHLSFTYANTSVARTQTVTVSNQGNN